MEECEQQANKFLEKTGTEFKIVFLKNDKYFDDNKETRDIYEITLKRGEREYKFRFGQSINDSGVKLLMKRIQGVPSDEIINWENSKIRTFNVPDETRKKGHKRVMRYIHDKIDVSVSATTSERKVKIFSEPTPYDVLASLQKYDIGTFEDFCSEFGYDTDSRKAEKIYKGVVDEYNNLKMLYSDKEIEEMREIN